MDVSRNRLFYFPPPDRVSLCSLGYSGTLSVDQAGHDLRDPPASASRVLGSKVSSTVTGLDIEFLFCFVLLKESLQMALDKCGGL